MAQTIDLTGAWQADDGAVYYIRHFSDNSIWWAGLHAPFLFHAGLDFTNVLHGVFDPRLLTISASWADVPRGQFSLQSGTLSLDVLMVPAAAVVTSGGVTGGTGDPQQPPPALQLRRRLAGTTGGFGGSLWNRGGGLFGPLPLDFRFQNTKRNGNGGQGAAPFKDHITPYRDFTVVFGDLEHADLTYTKPHDYCTFIRNDGEDQDGDLNFDIHLTDEDRSALDAQLRQAPNFVNPEQAILARLNARRQPADPPDNRFHVEAIMYGRENEEDQCNDQPGILMPGWMETDGNSVLLNGRPIEGRVSVDSAGNVLLLDPFHEASGQVPTIIFRPPMRVRVNGCIALDGHEDREATDAETLLKQRPEIHPVYAVDVVQDFSRRIAGANLTGAWHADDFGTYYLHQVDEETVWWLGLSRDGGQSFANVFQGMLQGTSISGDWADIPLGPGGARSGGQLVLEMVTGRTTTLQLSATQKTGGFGGSNWQKLYDRPLP
jgi:hypothetical protein